MSIVIKSIKILKKVTSKLKAYVISSQTNKLDKLTDCVDAAYESEETRIATAEKIYFTLVERANIKRLEAINNINEAKNKAASLLEEAQSL